MNALLDDGIAWGSDSNEILISLQRGIILLAMTLALLGQHTVLNRLIAASIAVPTLCLVASVTVLIGTFSQGRRESCESPGGPQQGIRHRDPCE